GATFERSLIRSIVPEEVTAAFGLCGVEQGGDRGGQFGGGFVGTGIGDPAVRECLNEQLGDDFADAFGGAGGGRDGSGLIGGGLPEGFAAALEECGVDVAAGGFGGGFGGRGGGFRGEGPGGFGGDGSFQECLTDLLGPDAFDLLRNPTGDDPSDELREALEECGGGIAIPVEPGGGIGDGAGPITIDPAAEATAVPIPVSELTIEQLTCLSDKLDPADLASAVVATSSGDLSQIPDEILAALQTCGVGV
ncbi:MAG: hypothetical protein V3T49_08610, partial [Dehalococcoidia bacterium]